MKNKKKVVILIILILMMISIFSENVIAEVVEGNKDEISWSYDSETKKLTFSGSGEIDANWKDDINREQVNTIEIQDGVTSIGNSAFIGCKGLTSIEIPASVTSIEDSAFNDCTGLTSINVSEGNQDYYSESGILYNRAKTCLKRYPQGETDILFKIPTSVTSIEDYAFYGCTGLTSIEIPTSVASIGREAFMGCTGLTSIEIPDGLTSIGWGTFYGCTGLTSIEIPASVTSVGARAFTGCRGLTSIEIPSSVTSIGGAAFEGCTGIISIEIPTSVTSIESEVFKGCTGLTSIEIPDSVTSIGYGALNGCTGLTSIEIPTSVTSIGSMVFYGCTGVTSIEIPDSITSIEGATFYGCAGLTSIEIPASVTSIRSDAFRGCTGLTSIEIPDSVISIGTSAFSGCTDLTIYCRSNSTAQQYAQGNNIQCVTDDTPPTIAQLTQEGTYIKITATDNEGGVGLAKIPYSINGENWQTNNSIAVETTGEYEVSVKDKLGNVATRKINIDLDKPIINKIDTDGKKIIIDARDEISGLAEKAYSLDGENWQASNTIEVTKSGTYRVFVRDMIGNIETGNVTVDGNTNTPSVNGSNTNNQNGKEGNEDNPSENGSNSNIQNKTEDFTAPQILDIQVEGKKIKIIAKYSESGLAEKAYSLDGEKWQESNEITVEKDGRYMVYVKDKSGNIARKLVTVPSTSSQTKVIENNTDEESKDIQKDVIDTTVAPEKFGQFGETKGMILIISLISVLIIIAKRKLKKYS